jgi:hypothetical protein
MKYGPIIMVTDFRMGTCIVERFLWFRYGDHLFRSELLGLLSLSVAIFRACPCLGGSRSSVELFIVFFKVILEISM